MVTILIAGAIGCVSLVHGYTKHHRQVLPMVIFGFGLLLLVAKQLLHSWQLVFLLPAISLILIAHLPNFRLSQNNSS